MKNKRLAQSRRSAAGRTFSPRGVLGRGFEPMESRLLLSGTSDLPTVKITFVNNSAFLDVGVITSDQFNWNVSHTRDHDAGPILSGNLNGGAQYSDVLVISPTSASSQYTGGGGWILVNPQPSLVSQPAELMPIAPLAPHLPAGRSTT